MCDQTKSIATSFMCGKDLDNYLRNPYYAGPFTQGTRMLNKYRINSTNPCIDHYENLQFEGCCESVKCNQAGKKKSQSKSKCCNNNNNHNNNKPPPQLCCSNVSSESDMISSCSPPPCCPPPPPPCCPPPQRCPQKEQTCNEEEEDPIAKRCKQLGKRGKTLLTQIERTKLPTIVVEDDEYLPSIMGCGWQIATKPRILGKSKFTINSFDPYLMLHSWQVMSGIPLDDENRKAGGSAHTLKETDGEIDGETDGNDSDGDEAVSDVEQET